MDLYVLKPTLKRCYTFRRSTLWTLEVSSSLHQLINNNPHVVVFFPNVSLIDREIGRFHKNFVIESVLCVLWIRYPDLLSLYGRPSISWTCHLYKNINNIRYELTEIYGVIQIRRGGGHARNKTKLKLRTEAAEASTQAGLIRTIFLFVGAGRTFHSVRLRSWLPE